MDKVVFKYIEKSLKEYPKLPKYISEREEELRYPVKPQDDNIGGGKALNKRNEKQEYMMITIDEDKRLNALKRKYRVITSCLDDAGSILEVILNELYFKNHPEHTLNSLVVEHIIPVGRSAAFEIRQKFFDKLALELGVLSI